jgi:hypothetical protein
MAWAGTRNPGLLVSVDSFTASTNLSNRRASEPPSGARFVQKGRRRVGRLPSLSAASPLSLADLEELPGRAAIRAMCVRQLTWGACVEGGE